MSLDFTNNSSSVNFDYVSTQLKDKAQEYNVDVLDAIKKLNDNPDDPALLADLQHAMNKWSVVFNINSSVTRAMKDLMQGILQKIA